MRSSIISVFGIFAAIAGNSSALGINCRGSSTCSSDIITGTFNGDITGIKGALAQLIMDGHQDQHYAEGQQLACSGNLCAFYQNLPGGENAQLAYEKTADLQAHGCTRCGSSPTKPGNDVSTGQLTLNYVYTACCHGNSCYCLP